ncbi:MAG: hypothetical protein IPO21_06805 [Bacteroidales bacterium]|nr:hypothetical protein [Bacteroidales bacterium]
MAFENTQNAFSNLKQVIHDFSEEYNNELQSLGKEAVIEYKDLGNFEIELKIAGDLIVFNMHSNIFDFDKNNPIWKSSYVNENSFASYCGVINVYNFIADSFKFNRLDDIGYLIARIFVNKDNHYFVEGKRQLGFLYNDFSNSVLSTFELKRILESAILFTLDFDLLVPEYDNVNMITVAQVKANINNVKYQTAKRLGFQFQADRNDI